MFRNPYLRGIAFFGLILIVFLSLLSYDIWRFAVRPLGLNKPEIYYLRPGLSVNAMIREWQQLGIVNSPDYLKLIIRLKGISQKLQAGEYAITPEISLRDLLLKMVEGDVILRSVTLIEGWNFQQVRQILVDSPYTKKTLQGLTDKQIMQLLGEPQIHPEGQFFPDTYFFQRDTKDIVILQTAYAKLQQNLQQIWRYRAMDLPYQTPYELLIAASIIEKETQLKDEQPIVAAVIVNRLKKNMRLQLDPTVIYGLGNEYTGKISKADLRKQSPYNTYMMKGLTPTPISMPSVGALQAAAHPADVDYLYFVAKGDGSHHFSSNLADQNKAVNKYIRNDSGS